MALRRRAALRRLTPLKARKPKRRKSTAHLIDPAIRSQLEARSADGRCEICQRSKGRHAHHRLMRSHGGPDELTNLLWLCWACHRQVHAKPAESYERGWLLRAHQIPVEDELVERLSTRADEDQP